MRLRWRRSGYFPIAAVVVACALALAACGGSSSDSSSSGESSSSSSGGTTSTHAEPVKVSFAAGPVFDAQIPEVGVQKGYFEEVGIEAEVSTAVELAQGSQALAAGSLDFAFEELATTVSQAKTLDSLAWAQVSDLWYGLQFVAREGEFKTLEEFVASGQNEEEALRSTIEQLRGKTLITFYRQWKASLNGLLETLGLGPANKFFNIVDMPFPQGAVAFLRGEGDVYMGDLPGTFRVLEEGGVTLTSAKQWPPFPGSYLYVGWVGDKNWLSENEETALRVLGVLYRVADDLSPRTTKPNKLQDEALTIMYEKVNEESGASFNLDAARWVNKEVSPWLTADETAEVLFSPKSPQNFDQMVETLIEVNGEEANEKVIHEQVAMMQPLYEKYIADGESAKKDIAKAGSSSDPKVASLTEEAEAQLKIFNYLDASTKAGEAVAAMGS